MAKDPAFLFYPGDWLGGTISFTRHHKGAYMDLLMCQFNQGHMGIDDIKVVLGIDFELWELKLKQKFITDSNGLFYNKRLDEEKEKRLNFTQSRRDNLNHKVNHMEKHMDKHMENENKNENRNIIKDKNNKDRVIRGRKFIRPTLEEVRAYCLEIKSPIDPEIFFNNYESQGWIKANGLPVLNWKSTIRTWEKRNERTGKDQQSIGTSIERNERKERLKELGNPKPSAL